MTSSDVLRSGFLDILFENRNKEYGAYMLRKEYHKRLLLATLLSALLTVCCLYLVQTSSGSSTEQSLPDQNEVNIVSVALPEESQPLPPKRARRVAAGSVQSQAPSDITKIAADVAPFVTQDGATYSETPGDTGNDLPQIAAGKEQASAEIPPLPESPVPDPVSSAPSFPGGPEAWSAFLQKHLRVPADGEWGGRTTVLVRFIVSEEGTVTGFVVVQSGGAALDNEVIRVLRKMPRWKPAVSRGKNIPAAFTQPVTFQVDEE